MTRAASTEELEPLLVMCRAGRLFDVQTWVEQGKPVSLPMDSRPKDGKRNPLRVAMETGFHSLVQLLLEAGAPPQEANYDALDHAVTLRRPDLAALIIQHGADVDAVSMRGVVEMWQPEMVELFLANGASLVRHNPIAWGLINKIRPALGLLKRFAPEQPELMRQADIALRFHVEHGNAKWVALMLWAGADPWARGPDRLDEGNDAGADDADEYGGHLNAVEIAIIGGKLDVLRQKKLLTAPDADRPETMRLLEQACHAPDSQVLSLLLERGHTPQLLAHLANRFDDVAESSRGLRR